MVAVRLVGRGENDLGDLRAPPAGLEEAPGAGDVRFERGDGVPIGDRDDGLRREVNDGLDLVFTQDPLQGRLIANVTADHLDALELARPDELALGHPVTNQANDVSPALDEPCSPARTPPSQWLP